MSNTPIYLSVVLSTYNEEKYIAQSVQSILNQTYPYFELIIVNDGSTDNTLQVIKSFEDPRIVIIDKPNSGLPDSLNAGIRIAKYDWIARMDGDDIAEPTRFENQVKYIDEQVGVIGGQFVSIDENGISQSNKISSKPLSYFSCKCLLFFGMSPLAHPTVIIRKSYLNKYGGYDINFKAAQDMELWSRLAPTIKIINIPNQLLYYRIHSNNITNKRHELQRELSFIGFIKYILKIRKPLSVNEFNHLKSYFAKNGLINRNAEYYLWSHNGSGISRNVKLSLYYMWRLMLVMRYRIFRKSTIKRIFT